LYFDRSIFYRMKIRRLYPLFLLAFTLVLAISCQRNKIDFDNPNVDTWDPSPASVSVSGLIVNENGVPFAGVSIKAGAEATITNSKGYFRFDDITLDKLASLITAEAAGYFKSFRVFTPANGMNFIKIQLIKKTLRGTVNASSGGSVTTDGYKVTFTANSIVNKTTGAAYSGNISVYATAIDPTEDNISAIIPGGLMAKDKEGNRALLESFGMIAVELRGTSGEDLQVKSGSTAKIDFAIPASKLAKAPASIPLWYVDETTGVWTEEGTAVKNGNSYTGDVKHFSYWNCDNGLYDLVTIELTIKNMAGRPIPYALHSLIATLANGAQGQVWAYTDSAGHCKGLVPRNASLRLEVLNDCYTLAYAKELGQITQNTNIGDVQVNPGSSEVTISGKLLNCNNQPVTNGWVDIYLENKTYKAQVNNSGQFSISIIYCIDPDVSIVANDLGALRYSAPYSFNIGSSNLSNLQLVACGNATALYMTSVLAGTQANGYVDATGTAARFKTAYSIVMDTNGNLFVTDEDNHCVRKITQAGVVTTFAGNGTQGYADGTGTAARFNRPHGIAIDNSNNLYVTDCFNHRIRKITPAGVVSTFAGDGIAMWEDGPPATASFWLPNHITFDPSTGSLFLTETGNQTIREIEPNGQVWTIAGDGIGGTADGMGTDASFDKIGGITVTGNGDMYVCDDTRIRKVTRDGLVTTLSGNLASVVTDGPLIGAQFGGLSGIYYDGTDNLYVTDHTANRIRRINLTSDFVSTFVGNGNSGYTDGLNTVAEMYHPRDITRDANGNFYIIQAGILIRKLTRQ
jgi:hypothetical protein